LAGTRVSAKANSVKVKTVAGVICMVGWYSIEISG
jgi:hypothetical protein